MLDFVPVDAGTAIPFIPGQYMNLFPSPDAPSATAVAKPYSIASIPTDDFIRFAIRKKGEVSSALYDLALGEEVIADGPYGTLCPTPGGREFICFAGGIGAAPFVGWMRAAVDGSAGMGAYADIKIKLLLSNTAEARAPFLDEIFVIADKDKERISVTSFLTRQSAPASHPAMMRHIEAGDMEAALKAMPGADIVICGSISFTRDLWRAARALGIEEGRIFTEAFY